MPTNTQEMIIKTIESSSLLTGGQLNPTQQREFFRLIRTLPGMFSIARFETVDQKKHHIDRLHIGEPITHAVEENSNEAHLATAKTSQIEIYTKKLKSSWNITTETLTENIEKGNFEQTIMEGMTQRIGTDLELLAIQGNTAKYAADNTPLGLLLRRDDGWDVLTEGAHIVDCGGATIQRSIFAEMIRRMPQQYLADPGLRWIVSRTTYVDWLDLIADRGTAQGDRALEGNAPAPYGIPMEPIPLIPSDKELTVSTATPATIVGNRADGFRILTGVNDKLSIAVNGGSAVTVTLPQGTWFASQIANFINTADASLAGLASDDGFGRLILKTSTTGSTATITIGAIANDAYDELGLSEGTVSGANAGTGIVNEGTFIWLANPKNFIYVFLNGTRVYSEFNKDYDRLETVVYNEMDVQVENLDAIVKAVNIRRREI
jgi:HK97 family phage major capsid protein